MEFENLSLNVQELFLDLNNPRFPSVPDNERGAIMQMIELQDDKLSKLAKDIAEHGIDPSEKLIIFRDEENQSYTVLEGNRRLTALKLLNEPDLISNNKIVDKIKLIAKTANFIPDVVECVCFNNQEDADHWIKLKHTGYNDGIGRVSWTKIESDRYLASHGDVSFSNQLISFIKNQNILPQSDIRKLKLTNLSRLLQDPSMRERLGINTVHDGFLYSESPLDVFQQQIKVLVEYMIEPSNHFTVNRIRNKLDRKIFFDDLGIEAYRVNKVKPWKVNNPELYDGKVLPSSNSEKSESTNSSPSNLNASSENPTNNNESNLVDSNNDLGKNSNNSSAKTTDSNTNKRNKLNYPNPNREILVPANVKLKINDRRCSGIYKELKQLTFSEAPNSISVLFRVFLELSLAHYINTNSVTLAKDKTGLHDKVVAVSNSLQKSSMLDGPSTIALQVWSKDNCRKHGTLQQYIHNTHTFPEKTTINTSWDNLENLFKAIWA